ncbi:hypothetical protein ACLHDD_03450 [Pantoea sp. NSTU24]|uniref:hypothetical protein n=1 Tax=Pantoea sp. NSTU24 TaxID=3391144 RepID=UPI003D014B59
MATSNTAMGKTIGVRFLEAGEADILCTFPVHQRCTSQCKGKAGKKITVSRFNLMRAACFLARIRAI